MAGRPSPRCMSSMVSNRSPRESYLRYNDAVPLELFVDIINVQRASVGQLAEAEPGLLDLDELGSNVDQVLAAGDTLRDDAVVSAPPRIRSRLPAVCFHQRISGSSRATKISSGS